MPKFPPNDWVKKLVNPCETPLPLTALLPMSQGEKPLVAPLPVVTMGWTEAPLSFTGTTETATDLANWSLASGKTLGLHCLKQQADPDPAAEQGNMVRSLAPQEHSPIPMSLVDA